MTGLFDWLDKWWALIVRRRAVGRLSSEIDAYIDELASSGGGAKSAELLKKAQEAVSNGDIDRGWKYLQAAHRIELGEDGKPELGAAATSLREEAAKKLTSWRKETVEKLLPEGASIPARGNVYEAARLCDGHFNNQAYKDGLRRSNAIQLAIFLIAALGLVIWNNCKGNLSAVIDPTDADAFGRTALGVIAAVGFLGAAVSAVTNLALAKPEASARIPELVSSLHVTILRLLMGPASAILLYWVTQTDLSPLLLTKAKVNGGGYIILVIAFVAGFSERLVLRVAQSFDDKSSK